MIITFRGVRCRVRRIAWIDGLEHYWIKLPFRPNAYAMLSPEDRATNRKARLTAGENPSKIEI